MDTALSVEGLSKTYEQSGFTLGPLTFRLEFGRTTALFGKNGAGKSTFFQLITGNLDSTAGSVRVLGQLMNPDQYLLKRNIGYLSQNLSIPRWVTPYELLEYACALYELSHGLVLESLTFWDCRSYENRPLGSCSHGMQKRAALALAQIHKPDLLILDEPFTGLDLHHIRSLKDLIRSRQAEGKSTILSTHIAPYAAELCHDAYILDAGQLRAVEQWSQLEQDLRVKAIETAFFKGL